MVIKKDNGKVKIELTEDELIIKRIFKDRIIKRKDIRSACITEKSFIVLTYDYKIINVLISNVKWSFREQLKVVVDEINKEDIVFSSHYVDGNDWFLLVVIGVNPWIGLLENNTLINKIAAIIFLLIAVFISLRSSRFYGVIYNIDTKVFTRVGYKNLNKETVTIEGVGFVNRKESGIKYKINKSGYKFYLEYGVDKINYPVKHRQALKEIENYFIKTEILN